MASEITKAANLPPNAGFSKAGIVQSSLITQVPDPTPVRWQKRPVWDRLASSAAPNPQRKKTGSMPEFISAHPGRAQHYKSARRHNGRTPAADQGEPSEPSSWGR